MSEAAIGLQSIQLSPKGNDSAASLPKTEDEWIVEYSGDDLERGLVRWLEEVLYRGSAEGQWLCESELVVDDGRIVAQVSWANADMIEREVEVKAITLHELALIEVAEGEVIPGVDSDIPSFEGPGWMAQVVFDI
jgi:SHS2 domain-containing protein